MRHLLKSHNTDYATLLRGLFFFLFTIPLTPFWKGGIDLPQALGSLRSPLEQIFYKNCWTAETGTPLPIGRRQGSPQKKFFFRSNIGNKNFTWLTKFIFFRRCAVVYEGVRKILPLVGFSAEGARRKMFSSCLAHAQSFFHHLFNRPLNYRGAGRGTRVKESSVSACSPRSPLLPVGGLLSFKID